MLCCIVTHGARIDYVEQEDIVDSDFDKEENPDEDIHDAEIDLKGKRNNH